MSPKTLSPLPLHDEHGLGFADSLAPLPLQWLHSTFFVTANLFVLPLNSSSRVAGNGFCSSSPFADLEKPPPAAPGKPPPKPAPNICEKRSFMSMPSSMLPLVKAFMPCVSYTSRFSSS